MDKKTFNFNKEMKEFGQEVMDLELKEKELLEHRKSLLNGASNMIDFLKKEKEN